MMNETGRRILDEINAATKQSTYGLSTYWYR